MTKLNGRAFEILRAEVERCATDNPIGKTEKQIVMKRLEKLRQEKGSAVTLDELHDTVFDSLIFIHNLTKRLSNKQLKRIVRRVLLQK
jgi:hypothetical protein